MDQPVKRSFKERVREGITWDERWRGYDNGLITCWEVGRKIREEDPEIVEKVTNNELPLLGWKGGVDRTLKIGKKYGTLNYLAQWQGIKGEDLNIDPQTEYELVCSRTKVKVIFTNDPKKYGTP